MLSGFGLYCVTEVSKQVSRIFKSQTVQEDLECLMLENGIDKSRNISNKYQPKPHNIPEVWRLQLYCGGRLKSRIQQGSRWNRIFEHPLK